MLPSFDFFDQALRGDRFHQTMAELAAESWLATTPVGYAVLDREAIEFFLRSKAVAFPGVEIAQLQGITEGPLWDEVERNIINVNGADHARLRQLVNPAFTPRAADRFRPAMRGFLAELTDRLGERFEAVADLCKPYPSMVIATVLGAPLADAGRLWGWSNLIQRQFTMNLAEERAALEAAVVELNGYLEELIERRRAEPGEDLTTALIHAKQDDGAAARSGEPGRRAGGRAPGDDRLSEVELVNLILDVLIGAVDTTQSQLAHSLRLFAQHPDQWRALAADPSLAPAAVEEALRYEPVTPFTARVVREELSYRDVTFEVGTLLMLSSFNGNRESGDTFDITAPRDGRTLTFGAGIHYCLGANLARAELQEALAYLPSRLPGLALDGEPEYGSVLGIYGLERLPLSRAALARP
jgi:cytochrome P450